ncbi:MAG: hypothetical protein DRO88_10115 [Promethearchaeia archaeon]|nr:MAG: hypothetical protein DRO88_10115 [Candidatus Lokiarchaeia archaeon]
MSDRSVIIPSSTAEESAQKYFQTIQLLLTRFKRSSNRHEIYKLTGERTTLSNLLAGACAIQCFHYLGIRTQSKETMISRESQENLQEIQEKQELFHEISLLFNNMLDNELNILLSFSNFESQILENLLNQAGLLDYKINSHEREHARDFLFETLQIYPDIIWLDIIGKYLGLTTTIRVSISQTRAKIRPTSIDLEKELISETGHDKYIELSTVQILYHRLLKNYNLKSLKEIRLNPTLLEKILTDILKFQKANLPDTKEELYQYLIGLRFRIAFFKKLQQANSTKIKFERLEKTLIEWIIQQLKEKAVNNIDNFRIFLEKILEFNPTQLKSLFSQYGFNDYRFFGEIQTINVQEFLQAASLNQLTKEDFLQFNKYVEILDKIQKLVDEIHQKNQLKGTKSITKILQENDEFELGILQQACDFINIDLNYLKSIFLKKLIISSSIQPKFPLSGEIENYALLFDIDHINYQIAEDVFFNLFSNIIIQIARIYETYVKVKKDKSIILLGLKRIFDSTEEEDWIRVKIEELIIQRLMHRQEELTFIFDAQNDCFFVNAFILARFFDSTLQRELKSLSEEPAFFYSEVGQIPLKKALFSPHSYVIAYEILERFKSSRISIRKEREEILEKKKKKDKKKREKISSEQQLNTFNWIEKKITSALISVSAVSVNPTSIYWTEKDNRLSLESLLIHAKLTHRKICSECGKDTTTSLCEDHPSSSIDATPMDLVSQYYHFAISRIKELYPSMKYPKYAEIFKQVQEMMNQTMSARLNQQITRELSTSVLDGELRDVAAQIVKKIGKILDKAIYKKFKENLRKKRT